MVRKLHTRMAIVGTLLFALYTGVVAWLWAGGFSLPLVVASVGAFIAIQWIISTKTVLWGINSTELPEDDLRWLHTFIEESSDDMGINKPNLYIAEMGTPNAFAIGRHAKSKVVFSKSLLETLPQDEVQAVAAHELAHIKNRDALLMRFGQSLASLVSLLIFFIGLASEEVGILTSWLLGSVANFFVTLLVLALSRQREYTADETAKELMGGDGRHLSEALTRIATLSEGREPTVDANTSALCIFNADTGFLNKVLSTHPPIEQRIERLE